MALPECEIEAGSESDSDSDTEPDSDTESDSDTDADSESDSEPEPEPEPGAAENRTHLADIPLALDVRAPCYRPRDARASDHRARRRFG